MNLDPQCGRTGHDPFRFGLHVSIAGGLDRIFCRGEELGVNAVQIFSHSSRSWEFDLPGDEILSIYHRTRTPSSVSRVYVHASYLINTASEDTSILKKSRETLLKELQTADLLKADGLVLHPGSARGGDKRSAVLRSAQVIREVLDSLPDLSTPLLLENTAGAGSMLGAKPEELKEIFIEVDRPQKMGLCLDSCHLFASGFDISKEDRLDEILRDFMDAVPSGQISLWHLNDAMFGLASGKDRHAGLGEGHLGSDALTRIVKRAKSAGVPLILETPKGEGETLDRLNLRRLLKMANQPVPDILRDKR